MSNGTPWNITDFGFSRARLLPATTVAAVIFRFLAATTELGSATTTGITGEGRAQAEWKYNGRARNEDGGNSERGTSRPRQSGHASASNHPKPAHRR
jgi:hypothetical protein